jgi:hypothetical protein
VNAVEAWARDLLRRAKISTATGTMLAHIPVRTYDGLTEYVLPVTQEVVQAVNLYHEMNVAVASIRKLPLDNGKLLGDVLNAGEVEALLLRIYKAYNRVEGAK